MPINYDYYTGETSKLVRQLSIAGIAVIWIFKFPNQNIIPQDLKFPLFFFISTLAFDLFHYLVGSILSQSFEVNDNLPRFAMIILRTIFYLKCFLAFCSYSILIKILITNHLL